MKTETKIWLGLMAVWAAIAIADAILSNPVTTYLLGYAGGIFLGLMIGKEISRHAERGDADSNRGLDC